MDLQVAIKTDGVTVNVDKFDEGVWLSLQLRRGSAHTTMTVEQAKQLIAALQNVVDAL
jgi:hypothetical protein